MGAIDIVCNLFTEREIRDWIDETVHDIEKDPTPMDPLYRRDAIRARNRIPEGITFTADGTQLLVQYHPDRTIGVLSVVGERLEDHGTRIDVPGQPSAIRAVEHPRRPSSSAP